MSRGSGDRRQLGWVYAVALAVAVMIPALAVWAPEPLQVLRLKLFDAYQQIRPRPATRTPVVIVDIDEASLAEFGQWPWPRSLLASLLDKLAAYRVAVVGFDIVFAEPDRLSPDALGRITRGLDENTRRLILEMPANDTIFARAIAANRVVLGQSVTPEPDAASATKKARKAAIGELGGNPRPFLMNFGGVLRNLPELEEAAKGLGLLTVVPEFDGIVRRLPTLLRVGKQIYPSLGLEMLRVATGQSTLVVKSNKAGIISVVVAGKEIPTDRAGRSWVWFNHRNKGRYVSAKDVLNGTVPPQRLGGHLVLVGSSAIGLHDIRASPVDKALPGVEINAQWIEAALSDGFLSRPNYMRYAEFAATIALCAILAILLPLSGALVSLLVGMGSVAALVGGSWYLYVEKGMLFGIAYPALGGFVFYTVLMFMNYIREEAQRRRIRHAFAHYLSPDLVAQIARDPGKLKLSGEFRELTFLFTDIAGFTSIVEKASPDELVNLLNEYLDGMCRIVMDHGGTIDKIVGDAVHAMFGAPGDMPDHAPRAVACALELDAFAQGFVEKKAAEGVPFGETRIGVNTGAATVGNFGGSARFDYTAHGDAINAAARMESVNKHLGTRICIAGTTAERCADVRFRPVGNLILKGKTEGVEAFEPLADGDAESPGTAAYRAAFALMRDGDSGARAAFEDVERQHPDDPLARLHARRLAAGDSGATIVMAEK